MLQLAALGAASLAGCTQTGGNSTKTTESEKSDWRTVFDYPQRKDFEYEYVEYDSAYAKAVIQITNTASFNIDFCEMYVGIYDMMGEKMKTMDTTVSGWGGGETKEFTIELGPGNYDDISTDYDYLKIENIDYKKR